MNKYHCYKCGYHKDFTDEEAENDRYCLAIRSVHQNNCPSRKKEQMVLKHTREAEVYTNDGVQIDTSGEE